MLKNYFTVAFRNLIKNKISSTINIGGLSVGMAVAILIGLWIYDEVSFDKYHRNYDRIAQVLQNQTFNGEVQTWWSEAYQMAPALRTSYGSQFKQVVMANWTGDHLLSFGEKKVTDKGIYMEPGVMEMLTLKMIKGNWGALKDPSSIILSQKTAKSIFGDTDPMGKNLKIDDKLNVTVTGVYEDLPDNTSFADLHFIAPWQLGVASEHWDKQQWGNSWFQCYVQIADHADMKTVSANIKNVKSDNSSESDRRFKPEIFLNPMRRWHLYSDFKDGVSVGGRIQYVWLFGIIGIFVLVLACINFMNLSTARSEKRAKEVGIRKAIGSLRGQLIGQFFSESLLVALLAFVVSLLLVQLLMPFFNRLSDKHISVPANNTLFWLTGIGFSLITGLFAGSYPALYLSSFRPIKVLKGSFRVGRLASVPRKALVVLQFTVSVVLIIGTIVIFRQIEFAKDRPVGYSRDGLLTVPIKTEDIHTHYDALRQELLRTGAIQEVAVSESPVTDVWVTNSGFNWKGKDPNLQEEFGTLRISPEFGKTAGWEIKEGRDFSPEMATDSLAFVINETAAKYIGMKHPVGETIKWGDEKNFRLFHIIGVVKDMVMQSPYEPVKQTLFFLDPKRTHLVDIKILPQVSAHTALGKIETVFKKYDPANPFEYRFADLEYAKKFGYEERIGQLASFFAILAIFISCLGLFGLASFVAEQRTREIGVRKVLGASLLNVWRLLSGEFVGLVMIALVIAGPVAWFLMQSWLKSYRYHSPIAWWIFAAAGGGALAITLLTVSWQAIKAGLMNPVKSLRSE